MRNLYSKTSFGQLHGLEIGDPNHDPVLFMHGFPGSSEQGMAFCDHVDALNIRVIAFDRPGYAHSDAVSRPSLRNFSLAIEEFLEEHKIKDFHLIGLSGGNPAAISSAIYFGKRVRAMGSICGLAPFAEVQSVFSPLQRLLLNFAKWYPKPLLEKLLDFMLKEFPPEQNMKNFAKRLNASDQKILADPKTQKVLEESIKGARTQGAKGIIFDLKTISRDWGAEISEMKCPYVLSHGKQDEVLSYQMSVKMHEKIPHSKLTLYETEGHYSLPLQRGRELLTQLMKEG